MRKIALASLLVLFLSLIGGLYFERYFVFIYKNYGAEKEVYKNWSSYLRETHPHVYVTAGGSSLRVGLQPHLLLDEYDVPVVVPNGNAGYGSAANVAICWPFVREGDTFVLALEPQLLFASPYPAPTKGLKMMRRALGIEYFAQDFLPLTWDHLRRTHQCSAHDVSVFIARLFYPSSTPTEPRASQDASLRPDSGWTEGKVINHHLSPEDSGVLAIDPQVIELYKEVQAQAAEKNVRVIALLPCIYGTEKYRNELPKLALELTKMGIPVVKDPEFGVMGDGALFSDTTYHPNARGSEIYTRRVGEALSKQQFWTVAELEALIEPAEQAKP